MGKLQGESTAEINAPIDEVYAICADVPTAADWQGGYRRLTPLETDDEGRATLVEVVADGKIKDLTSHQRFSYEPPHSVRWEQVKGDLKTVKGSWTLEDLGDGRTRATFALDGDPGRVLGMAIRGPVETALRAILVTPRAKELKARAEAG